MDDITLPQENDDDPFFVRPVKPMEEIIEESPRQGGTGLPSSTSGNVGGHQTEETSSTSAGFAPLASSSGAGISERVTIKFGKFVQLVANHSFIEVIDKNADQDIVVSGNLLTDLANAHDRSSERRMPAIFAAGLVIGVILTYIITR